MFGPRTPRYPLLKSYLDARAPTPRSIVVDRRGMAILATTIGGVSGVAVGTQGFSILAAIGLAWAAVLGVQAYRTKPPAPPTPEQELAHRADGVVAQLKGQAHLHRALHPAVAATLEECAGYWMRIAQALDGPQWTAQDATPQWVALRQEALAATKLAMDEAIVHAGSTLAYVPPPKPLEHVSDALEDIGFGPIMRNDRSYEPMPPTFKPVRELAERLRELATRCETAATQRREESPEPVSAAFRRLDAALGEMRHLEEAEGELRQGA